MPMIWRRSSGRIITSCYWKDLLDLMTRRWRTKDRTTESTRLKVREGKKEGKRMERGWDRDRRSFRLSVIGSLGFG